MLSIHFDFVYAMFTTDGTNTNTSIILFFFRVLVSACAGYCCYDTLDKIALDIIKTVSKYSAVQYTSYLRLFCYRFYVCLLLLDSFKYKHIHSHTKTYSKSTNNSPSKTNS